MGNFNRDRGGRSGGGFGGNGGGGFGGDRDRTMHKAICSSCHKECEVPFRPSGDKPVYCNNCFSKTSTGAERAPRRDFGGDRPQQRPSFDGGNRGGDDTKRQLEAISSKLDKLTQAIENLSRAKTASTADVTAQEKVAIKALTSLPKKAAVKITPKVVAKKVVKKAPTKKGKK